MAAQILQKNKMSASQLKAEECDNINFVENPRTGKLFFTCGQYTGYISPKVRAAHQAGTLQLADMQFAECQIDGGNWVPCLMMKATNHIIATY